MIKILCILLVIFVIATFILVHAYFRLRILVRFLKDELDHDDVLRGEDAKRFVEAMNNPVPISREEYLRAKNIYEAVFRNSRRSSAGRAIDL